MRGREEQWRRWQGEGKAARLTALLPVGSSCAKGSACSLAAEGAASPPPQPSVRTGRTVLWTDQSRGPNDRGASAHVSRDDFPSCFTPGLYHR